jgi:hypothetical protein
MRCCTEERAISVAIKCVLVRCLDDSTQNFVVTLLNLWWWKSLRVVSLNGGAQRKTDSHLSRASGMYKQKISHAD